MQVYIEYVIIDNLLIDYFILSITQKMCKTNCKNYKLWLIALLGTFISILSPFLSGVYLVLTKILCSVLIPFLLLEKNKGKLLFKRFLVVFLCFLLSTMIMGGACIMLCSLLGIDYTISDGSLQIYNFPIGLALLVCFVMYVIVKNLVRNFYSVKHLSKFLYDITLKNEQKTFVCKAFLDTGNRAVDEKTNQPIVLINFSIFSKLFPEIKLTDLLLKRYQNFKLKNMHEIDIKSLSNSSKILVFEIDNIMIDEKVITNFMLGLSLKNFNETLSADCILNPLIFEN